MREDTYVRVREGRRTTQRTLDGELGHASRATRLEVIHLLVGHSSAVGSVILERTSGKATSERANARTSETPSQPKLTEQRGPQPPGPNRATREPASGANQRGAA